MTTFNVMLLRAVRWSGWPLIPVVGLFLVTGYIMDGRFGMSGWLDEKTALTYHRMLHVPLIFLVLAHSLAAVYLALVRWGWIRTRSDPVAERSSSARLASMNDPGTDAPAR